MFKIFSFEGMTLFTKTVSSLKKEAQLRRRKLYEERHRRDRTQLISMILAFALVGSTAIYV